MRLVASVAPPGLVEWRHRLGVDRHDEMWEGVLHMNPLPNRDHQELVSELWLWLRTYWARPRGNRVYLERNVASLGGWPNDYRGPDLVLLTPDRFPLDKNQYIEGPPLVTVEVRSPDDESYNKLSFYAALGVPEVWVIDRDTKQPEIFALSDHEQDYSQRTATADNWLLSNATGVELRATDGGKLAVRIAGDAASCHEIPEG